VKNSYRKILLISEANIKPDKLYVDQMPKLAKGLIRSGHDVRQLSYTSILAQLSPFKSRSISQRFYKARVDEKICDFAKHYNPDIVFIGFSRGLDVNTVRALREASPSAVFIGWDGDPWPMNNIGRVELGCELDILFATNNGSFLEDYKRHGAKKCLFLPNLIDPDNEYRYSVGGEWNSDVLWTGKVQHSPGIEAGEVVRQNVLARFAGQPRVSIYGCLGYPQISGIDYLHAISGARIGISVNAINTVSLYHSDRFTHYSACGAMVLAKRVPDTELLMEHKKHVCYFDDEDECKDLVSWYLQHESERKKIAEAGMAYCHENFNAVRVTGYMLDAVETGQYKAPWGVIS